MAQPNIMMVGLPFSGKTTHAKLHYGSSHLILSTEQARFVLYGNNNRSVDYKLVLAKMVQWAKLAGELNKPIVYDACNLKAHRREEIMKELAPYVGYDWVAVCVNTDKWKCIRRNRNSCEPLPEEAIHKLAHDAQTPTSAEGFARRLIV